MKFEWDHVKEKVNKEKHRVAFPEAAYIFADKYILNAFDQEHSEDEDRWVSIGQTPSGAILTVVHTYRNIAGEERIRIISARKATRKETQQYLERRG